MSKKRINEKTERLFNEGYQYRLNEKKTNSSLSRLIYRLPFSLITSSSKYCETFYGCKPPRTEIESGSHGLKNTFFVGFDYEKHCDGQTKAEKLIKFRKKITSKKTISIIKKDNNGNFS